MRNLILAGVLALAGATADLPEAQAASVVLKSNGAVVIRDRHLAPRPPRVRRHHTVVCKVKTVRHYRNHRLIIEKTKVCR